MSIVPRECISKFTAASRDLRCYCTPLVVLVKLVYSYEHECYSFILKISVVTFNYEFLQLCTCIRMQISYMHFSPYVLILIVY